MSDNKIFKEGDIVRLKSGGPIMTVSSYLEYGGVFCQWFEKTELKKGSFQEGSLELADKDNAKIKKDE